LFRSLTKNMNRAVIGLYLLFRQVIIYEIRKLVFIHLLCRKHHGILIDLFAQLSPFIKRFVFMAKNKNGAWYLLRKVIGKQFGSSLFIQILDFLSFFNNDHLSLRHHGEATRMGQDGGDVNILSIENNLVEAFLGI